MSTVHGPWVNLILTVRHHGMAPVPCVVEVGQQEGADVS